MKALIWVVMVTAFAGTSEPGNTGTIRGAVKNADTGELLPMSRVFLYPSNRSVPPRIFRTRSGTFVMVGVPQGHYNAFGENEGFRSFVAQGVYVKADSIVELDLRLKVTTGNDSAGVVRPGKPGVDYKMKYFTPDIGKFR
jgi:hypothetical protein